MMQANPLVTTSRELGFVHMNALNALGIALFWIRRHGRERKTKVRKTHVLGEKQLTMNHVAPSEGQTHKSTNAELVTTSAGGDQATRHHQ